MRFGISGRLARTFQNHALTPVLAIAGLLLGIAAVLITPREEEPQIDVTMADVIVAFPGAPARDVESLVATPLERVLAEIEGIKHVYSASRTGVAVVTVEFQVGVPRQDALVRLYDKVWSHADLLPAGLGVSQPLVRPLGIDDVPVMALTLWADDPAIDGEALAEVARSLQAELKRVPGTRDVELIGAPRRAVLVQPDAQRLTAHGLSVTELGAALAAANIVAEPGARATAGGHVPLTLGTWLADADEVAQLVIGLADGKPLRIADVANVERGADRPDSLVWHGAPPGRAGPVDGPVPAVTLSVAKKPGTNATQITAAVLERLAGLRIGTIPDGVNIEVVRDYGATAADKANTLIQKLVFATGSVVLLVLFALGWREAIVVGTAVVLTLALTLFASWAMGFTLNRVSLFALIFSIGILVDDAIVVVENIHRHMRLGGKSLREAIPPAVDEVGGPTILATFTVIAALLPMAFVTGLMGPYMRPIPINASVGMALSLLIALTVTPWLALKLLRRHGAADDDSTASDQTLGQTSGIAARLHRLFERLLRPFLDAAQGGKRRAALFAVVALLVGASIGLAGMQWVVLKMLPFDNKSEFQIVVDLPEGAPLERTNALLAELAEALSQVPEVASFQGYAGTSAPITFNGLVRQYYLREGANLGDLQVNLVDKSERRRQSHTIARAVRPMLVEIGARYGAALKVIEVPPGPPVLSPIVAEVYGPDHAGIQRIAKALEARFAGTEGIVDIDTTVEAPASRDLLVIDRDRAARLGVPLAAITELVSTAVAGSDVSFIRDGRALEPVPIRLRLPAEVEADLDRLLALVVRSHSGALVPLSELVRPQAAPWDNAILHKNGLPVAHVMADEAGRLDSPLYGMFDLVGQVADNAVGGAMLEQFFFRQPAARDGYAIKWDGEWQITFETFRDMGLAYAVGLVLIYLLVVGQFRSYLVPLVIMAPIPLTIIGVMPGHALLGKQFTATSMIGMIALAGIIVRNSILLVDFIDQQVARGKRLEDAAIEACAVRAQPIALTAVAAMAGALFILDDPIFNGLAISLVSGILVSTLLTLLVIPLLYVMLRRRWPQRIDDAPVSEEASS
ncbi:efflux RND transporter permease subunit [Denitratimonas sp. CY0512]|uniref:efflux RND transporter permease subunit n=1 Tax=Denitratimonas sp. CY0512 TaxID=3131940 RepID=UPI0030A69ABE